MGADSPTSATRHRRAWPIPGSHGWQRVAAILLALAVLSITMPRFVLLAETNRQAVALLRRAVSTTMPWTEPLWWSIVCSEPLEQPTAETQDALLDAHTLILAGDCLGAVRRLENAVKAMDARRAESIVLAYTYSMLGRWRDAAETMPTQQLAAGNWPARRYWGNVLLRAGTASGASTAYALEADRLLGSLRPEGSLSLARYWAIHDDPVAAFEEFRRALISMDDPSVLALASEYEALRREYVAKLATSRPGDAEWSHLAAPGLSPIGRPGQTDANPTYALDHALPDGRTLVGLTPDEHDLALGPLVHVLLFFREGDTLMTEARLVRNHMPDASFAWGLPTAGVRPFGYAVQYSAKQPYAFRIEHYGTEQYVCIDHGTAVTSNGLRGPSLPIPAELLVMAGRYRTDEMGEATFGMRWTAGGESIQRNVVKSRSPAKWQHTAAVAEAPAHDILISGYLLQYQSSGRACFDDLLLFGLDLSD